MSNPSSKKEEDGRHAKQMNPALLGCLLLALFVVGPTNNLLYKMMFSSYGQDGAYFVSQCVNAIYILLGAVSLVFLASISTRITPQMRATPQKHFIIMGALDCAGTFLAAMGAVHTPGQWQTLLNQSLIPFTIVCSAIFLKRKYCKSEVISAVLILVGAVVSLGPFWFRKDTHGTHGWWCAYLLYWGSSLPMALSAVYKEKAFATRHLNVFYLSQWISVYQFIFGFVLCPLLFLGGTDVHSFGDLWQQFYKGFVCYIERDPNCSSNHTFWLLTGYCLVNFSFNILGLLMVKKGSALLNGIAGAFLLPATTVMFNLPFLGSFREHLSSFTFMGLFVIIIGIIIHQRANAHSSGSTIADASGELAVDFHGAADPFLRSVEEALPSMDREIPVSFVMMSSSAIQPSFQERIVGTFE